jgi:choline kinase
MKAIILSAGQGRRLLPLTQAIPKCLVRVQRDRSILELQLRALAACGVQRATVMTGFGAERVEEALGRIGVDGLAVRDQYNPVYATTDNLVTTWLARDQMDTDFVLLNGDTLFEPDVLRRLLDAEANPISIVVDRKPYYDDDDMKVALGPGSRVRAIGKKLEGHDVDAEAIGMTLFRGAGVGVFVEALDAAVRRPEALRAWYPSVLNEVAAKFPVTAVSIHGLWWAEIDCKEDLASVRAALRRPVARQREAAVTRRSASAR